LVDCGYALVNDAGTASAGGPDTAQLFGTKRIQFDPSLPNNPDSWAPIALELLVKETAISACVSEPSECPTATPQPSCASTSTTTTTTVTGSTLEPQPCNCPVDACVLSLSPTPVSYPAIYCPG